MKKNTINIEQLFQELVSQDPSFTSQKKDILGLISRMVSHTPDILQDPGFQTRLKDNLHYHLVSQHIPAPQMNGWQKFLLYGLPSLAIGLALIYVLPTLPGQQSVAPVINSETTISSDTVTTNINHVNDISQPVRQHRESAVQYGDKKNTLPQQDLSTDTISEPIESVPLMMKTSMPIVGGDANSIPNTLEKSQLLQPTPIIQQYTNDNLHLSYTIDVSGDDLLLQGTLENCNHKYTLSEPLVGVSNNSTIIAQIKDTSSDNTSRISLHFTDGLITKVEGGDICK